MDRINHKPQSVNDAKNQLRQMSLAVDYLAPIKKPIINNPVNSVLGAFVAGYAFNKVAKKGLPPSLFSLLISAASKL